MNRDREQLLMIICDDNLKARVQGFQLCLITKLEKIWTKISISDARRGGMFVTLDKFADLWGDGITNWIRICQRARRSGIKLRTGLVGGDHLGQGQDGMDLDR